MGTEIERKFLVVDSSWRSDVTTTQVLRQGYLSDALERVVRVRLVDNVAGFLTIKGKRIGDGRPEFEYEIPPGHALFMLDHLCIRPLVEKQRSTLNRGPGTWTVDEFYAENEGLVLAEIELPDGVPAPDAAILPPWVGPEVTTDDRYANSSLASHPFARWAGAPPVMPSARP
ncbi:CYTH domain-containing protein [Micromonospora sediminicola]|uniref:CYTH domain-containing protein n=1 Tax=Micromonospora sediminicola TaxID=946078 RepID=UPI0037AAC76E